MKKTILTVAVVAFAAGTAFGVDQKSLPPSATKPGVTSQTPAVAAKRPDLVPLSSTAGQEPLFGVMNTGQANATGEFWITVNCLPTKPQTQGNCKLNTSNDPMADPNTNKVKVLGGVTKGGVPTAKWFKLSNIQGAAGPGSWLKGDWKFKVTVDSPNQVPESNEGNNSSQWHTWTKQ